MSAVQVCVKDGGVIKFREASFTVADGVLLIWPDSGENLDPLAVYAPGHWASAYDDDMVKNLEILAPGRPS